MYNNGNHLPRLPRISLAQTQPIVAAIVAAVLAMIFFLATVLAQMAKFDRISDEQTALLADLIAGPVAVGDAGEAIETVRRTSEGRFAIVLDSGELLAGDADIIGHRRAHSAALVGADGSFGQLYTRNLQPFELALPPWFIFGLAGFAVLSAYSFGRFYTRFSLNGLKAIEESLLSPHRLPAHGRAGANTFSFAEFTRIRLGLLRRIKEIQRKSRHYEALAYGNPDSGLPNLRAFKEALDTELAKIDSENQLAVLHLDIEQYQQANELLGYQYATTLAQNTMQRIADELASLEKLGLLPRGNFMIAHLQEDEFAVLLPAGTSRDCTAQIARNLRRAFVPPVEVDGFGVSLGLSGGIVIAPDDGERAVDLMGRAAAVLRGLRAEGRDGFAFYQARLDRAMENRLQFSKDLRTAVETGAFWPAFQPQVDLKSGQICGVEALARWTGKDGKPVSPAEFVPIAEQSGLIVDLGETILRKACAASAEWARSGWPVPVAVNVSPAQLDDPTFCDRVLSAIADSGLPPKLLELEITESMAVRDSDSVAAVLNPLRRLGVRLAIDDFGTGHANLSILTRLNFDVFKIDRSFVSKLSSDPAASAIVDMILAMAHTLNHDTVAEGVESQEQLDFLRERGCRTAQGYFISAPLSDAEFRKFLQAWRPSRVFPETHSEALGETRLRA